MYSKKLMPNTSPLYRPQRFTVYYYNNIQPYAPRDVFRVENNDIGGDERGARAITTR